MKTIAIIIDIIVAILFVMWCGVAVLIVDIAMDKSIILGISLTMLFAYVSGKTAVDLWYVFRRTRRY